MRCLGLALGWASACQPRTPCASRTLLCADGRDSRSDLSVVCVCVRARVCSVCGAREHLLVHVVCVFSGLVLLSCAPADAGVGALWTEL